ncbi:MAG TPA: DsbA family oxidoreductase [Burkholderiaceae bacterium]
MKIDFVSDVSCPWCAIGLSALQVALDRIGPSVPVALHFQPFELNPGMAPGGEDVVEHLSRKYGIDAAQIARNGEAIRQRGAELGFRFDLQARSRIYNTFDAHRLLHWAGEQGAGAQLALKKGLLEAYHGRGEDPGAHEVLVREAVRAGLDGDRAREVLASGAYASEVREAEQWYQQRGIHSVPAVIIDDQHLISGGQPPEVFEQAIRQLAGSPA